MQRLDDPRRHPSKHQGPADGLVGCQMFSVKLSRARSTFAVVTPQEIGARVLSRPASQECQSSCWSPSARGLLARRDKDVAPRHDESSVAHIPGLVNASTSIRPRLNAARRHSGHGRLHKDWKQDETRTGEIFHTSAELSHDAPRKPTAVGNRREYCIAVAEDSTFDAK